MPIYEYRCRDCGERFERIETLADHEQNRKVGCPSCGKNRTEHCWSRVAVETGRKGYHPAKPLDV